MSNFTLHSPQSAPEASKAPLRALDEVFGFVPNLARAMAESPVLIKGFVGLFQNVHAGSFSEAEIQVLLLTNALTNRSRWAIGFHTHLALSQGVSQADVDALRAHRAPADSRHAALSAVARSLIENRGQLDAAARAGFDAAGYRPDQLLELIGVVAASTLTNYAGNVVHPPLEDFLQATEATAAPAASRPSSGESD
ncbi:MULTISPECIES: carboxymuconolactone decarboxylase family protein [unclassified Rhizobacter]|uniref:carboxymuconolactone decarboxylase family protein n=1 Tax=unclassified Rhizobacter TaxID=2640088 RepID=UPI0006F5683F|nr:MULTISPECIES: carboxymuconolactone decarboxylase family protein [unclassified Rhizobacter]KQU66034.1 carboxymuconolactone decarboxylase [Rhizobacter sp. Root29]KQV97826.1 carboxymuconolactone decarboxylase [Rhizobacter sp. Root1238]KRB18788.1 carboxymuconolactone decarboxylase [Rhizobacter sp. Root16D2]